MKLNGVIIEKALVFRTKKDPYTCPPDICPKLFAFESNDTVHMTIHMKIAHFSRRLVVNRLPIRRHCRLFKGLC